MVQVNVKACNEVDESGQNGCPYARKTIHNESMATEIAFVESM